MRKVPASQHLAQAMHNVRISVKVRKRHWSNLPRESETKRREVRMERRAACPELVEGSSPVKRRSRGTDVPAPFLRYYLRELSRSFCFTTSRIFACVCDGVPRASTTTTRPVSRRAIAKYPFLTRPKKARFSCSKRFSSL